MTDYKKIDEGHKLLKEIYSEISPRVSREMRDQTSIFVYYVDRPFSSKSEDLVGLIIPPEDYSKIIKFVFFRAVYRAPNCKRLVGVDVEVKEPKRVLKYGLYKRGYGKIVLQGNRLSFSQKELLEVSLVGKGINVIGNISLVLEEMCDELGFYLPKILKNQ